MPKRGKTVVAGLLMDFGAYMQGAREQNFALLAGVCVSAREGR